MLNHEEEIAKLDKIARNLTGEGTIKSLKVPTPSGYDVEITVQQYRQLVEAGQNPITHIFNITSSATATAKSTLSGSLEIQNIMRGLEKSGLHNERLSRTKRNLDALADELNKPNPNEKVLRRVLNWASKFSFELFLRIAILVAERFVKGGEI